jgi:hypothetical protein
MRCVPLRTSLGCIALLSAAAFSLSAQQPAEPSQEPHRESFHWIDQHSRVQGDQDILTWVNRSLDPEKWTAIREIGVEYDAALVVTTLRATPQSPPSTDTFTVWSVSLVNHSVTPLLTGVNLRWLDWMHFAEGAGDEPVILYDNCRECAAETYFTAFHYDIAQHGFRARWMRGSQAVPVLSVNTPDGVVLTQIYAGLADLNGLQYLATWNHFDYGKEKPPEDYLYRFDVDPFSHLDRTELVSNKPADALKLKLCQVQNPIPGLTHGQDSELCRELLKPLIQRKPVTTPPANNHGKSAIPLVHK